MVQLFTDRNVTCVSHDEFLSIQLFSLLKNTLDLFHKKKAVHLKGFTEHVLSFFTPQQVDDHLFAVQPPQRSEVSGSNEQKHHEKNINRFT